MVGALRLLDRRALTARHVTAHHPAEQIAKRRRRPSNRRALLDRLLSDINRIAASNGNDPELDTLVLRLHLETACRRGGTVALRFDNLDPKRCLIRRHEKNDHDRWQPVTPTLMPTLLQHCKRGGDSGQLLRYRNGQPITDRRYDYLWNRIGKQLPWVATQQVAARWLRYTTLTWVGRHRGYVVARAYAGLTELTGNAGATLTYVRASLHKVAEALSAMTGDPPARGPSTAAICPLQPDPPQPLVGFESPGRCLRPFQQGHLQLHQPPPILGWVGRLPTWRPRGGVSLGRADRDRA